MEHLVHQLTVREADVELESGGDQMGIGQLPRLDVGMVKHGPIDVGRDLVQFGHEEVEGTCIVRCNRSDEFGTGVAPVRQVDYLVLEVDTGNGIETLEAEVILHLSSRRVKQLSVQAGKDDDRWAWVQSKSVPLNGRSLSAHSIRSLHDQHFVSQKSSVDCRAQPAHSGSDDDDLLGHHGYYVGKPSSFAGRSEPATVEWRTVLKRVTIKDVAARAGVGTMTVSRVLNASGYVAESMRQKVQRAIDDLGYVPNQMARGLRSRRSGTIALLVTDITNPFFTTLARGAEDAASDGGSLLLLCNTDEREDEELRYMRMLVEKQVDGVLLVPARRGTAAIRLATENGVSVVALDRAPELSGIDVVRCDAREGSYELGKLLLAKGHRGFAILAGPRGVPTSDDRVEGFQKALREANVSPAEVRYGELTLGSGADMAHKVVEAEGRPTAIFAVNNFLAYGALREFERAGIRVPEDIAVVAFDDLPEALLQFPFLTMVAQPAYEMGRMGIELLQERLAKEPRKEAKEILLPCNLVVRKSSG